MECKNFLWTVQSIYAKRLFTEESLKAAVCAFWVFVAISVWNLQLQLFGNDFLDVSCTVWLLESQIIVYVFELWPK